MVAMEIKQQDFLFSLPTIRMVNAESSDIATTRTGNCSMGLNIRFISPLFILHLFKNSLIYEEKTMTYKSIPFFSNGTPVTRSFSA